MNISYIKVSLSWIVVESQNKLQISFDEIVSFSPQINSKFGSNLSLKLW